MLDSLLLLFRCFPALYSTDACRGTVPPAMGLGRPWEQSESSFELSAAAVASLLWEP